MSDEIDRVPVDSDDLEVETEKLKKGVVRFAQYTAPAMLAMLASAGHDMAFAQGSTN